MKYCFTIILLLNLLLIADCQNNSGKVAVNNDSKPVSELEKLALSKLYQAIIKEKGSGDVQLKPDEIEIDRLKLKVATTVEYDGSQQGKWIFAVRFDTKIINDRETNITVGSIGIGTDRNDAIETSVDEWIGNFGTSAAKMLTESTTALSVANFKVYPGYLGIRGENPSQNWIDGSPAMNEKIISVLMPVIKKSNDEITSINLMMTAGKNGIIDGECKMNNVVSPELLNELKKLDWKINSTSYMFKQFYLVKKK